MHVLIKHATITTMPSAERSDSNDPPNVELTDIRGIAATIEHLSQVSIYRNLLHLHYLEIQAPEHCRPLRLFTTAYARHINSSMAPAVYDPTINERRATAAMRLLGAYAAQQSSQTLARNLEIDFDNAMFSMADESTDRLSMESLSSLLHLPEMKLYSMIAKGLLRNEVSDQYSPEFSLEQLSETILWHRPQ